MSNKTKAALDSSMFLSTKGTLKVLEAVLNFEHVDFSKTCENVAEWMASTTKASAIQQSDWNCLSADGASNAIGSLAEYEVVTRQGRSTSVDFNICYAHQNQRSNLRASGTVTFKTGPTNKELGNFLNKSHAIQARFYRSPNRMEELNKVQKRKNRNPHLGPQPRNDTRWDSTYDETKRSNQIMGDVCDTNLSLLSQGGDDRDLLYTAEKNSDNYDRLSYVNKDKTINRQYEGAAYPGRCYSNFLQDRRNTPSYVLLESQLVVKGTSAEYFAINSGKLCV